MRPGITRLIWQCLTYLVRLYKLLSLTPLLPSLSAGASTKVLISTLQFSTSSCSSSLFSQLVDSSRIRRATTWKAFCSSFFTSLLLLRPSTIQTQLAMDPRGLLKVVPRVDIDRILTDSLRVYRFF